MALPNPAGPLLCIQAQPCHYAKHKKQARGGAKYFMPWKEFLFFKPTWWREVLQIKGLKFKQLLFK
jgi:hypothetical protein